MKSKKLTTRFIGPYQIFRKIGLVAYQICLPLFLSNFHNVFHVSQLRNNLTFDVMPVQILDKKVKDLRGRQIPLVKVISNEANGDIT